MAQDSEVSRRVAHCGPLLARLVGGLFLLVLMAACGGDGETPVAVDFDPTPIEKGQYAPWVVGDTHVHLVGDSGVLFNNRCRPHDETGLIDVMDSLELCARRLVDATHEIAGTNGLEWAILTEHGPWLGSAQIEQCDAAWVSGFAQIALIAFNALESASCLRHVATGYSHNAARDSWQQINNELRTASETQTQMLLGQELGTAVVISALCTTGLASLPASARHGPGHVGVFTLGGVGEPIDNRITDCREDHYLQSLQDRGLFGAINHPDNGDGGSDWHCWTGDDSHPSGAPCDAGVDDFARSALSLPAGSSLPSAPAVISIGMATDTRAPTNGTINRMLTMIQQGVALGFTGGSDSHAIAREMDLSQGSANDGKIGLAARTYALVPEGLNRAQSPDDPTHPVRFALSTNATISTLGPLLATQVESALPGGTAAFIEEGVVDVAVSWPPDATWPHVLVNSQGYEVTEGEFVPRTQSTSHAPQSVDLFLVPLDPGCGQNCAPVQEIRVDVDVEGGTAGVEHPLVSLDPLQTDVAAGLIVLRVETPESPVDRWAIVTSGNYEELVLEDGSDYPVDSWVSPVWIDGSPFAAAFSTDDSEWSPDTLRMPVASTGDIETETISLAVRNQIGQEVPGAAVQLYIEVGDELVPVPARSSALETSSRYAPLVTGQDGVVEIQASTTFSYAVRAEAPRCDAADQLTPIDLDGGSVEVPITLTCLTDDALPVFFEPIVSGVGSGTVDVEVTCFAPGGEVLSSGLQSIPVNQSTEILQAPLGSDCSAVQQTTGPEVNGRIPVSLTPLAERMDVGAWGARFSTMTTANPQSASFVVENIPVDPFRPSGPIDVQVWCPGDEATRIVSVAQGQPEVIDGLREGEECGVFYDGDRLALWSSPLHQVLAVGDVILAGAFTPGADGQHTHSDALYSVVTFHIDDDATGWEDNHRPPPLQPTVLVPREVITATPEPSTVVLTATLVPVDPTPTATPAPRVPTPTPTTAPRVPTPTPTTVPEEPTVTTVPQPTCPDGFEPVRTTGGLFCDRLVGAEFVEATFECPKGFEPAGPNSDLPCVRVRNVVEEPEIIQVETCPKGAVERSDGCFEIREVREQVKPVEGPSIWSCPVASTPVGGAGPDLQCRPIRLEVDPCLLQPRNCIEQPELSPGLPQLTIATPTPDLVPPIRTRQWSCPKGAEGTAPEDCFVMRTEEREVKPEVRPVPVCRDNFTLVDGRCVGSETQFAELVIRTEPRWVCPPGTRGNPSSDDPFCVERRAPQ